MQTLPKAPRYRHMQLIVPGTKLYTPLVPNSRLPDIDSEVARFLDPASFESWDDLVYFAENTNTAGDIETSVAGVLPHPLEGRPFRQSSVTPRGAAAPRHPSDEL
jgi:hypothetical protein